MYDTYLRGETYSSPWAIQLACPIFCCLLLSAASNSLILGAAGEEEGEGNDVRRVPSALLGGGGGALFWMVAYSSLRGVTLTGGGGAPPPFPPGVPSIRGGLGGGMGDRERGGFEREEEGGAGRDSSSESSSSAHEEADRRSRSVTWSGARLMVPVRSSSYCLRGTRGVASRREDNDPLTTLGVCEWLEGGERGRERGRGSPSRAPDPEWREEQSTSNCRWEVVLLETPPVYEDPPRERPS